MDNPPKKQTKSKEFQAFEELAANLLAVPKVEVDKKKAKAKRIRVTKST